MERKPRPILSFESKTLLDYIQGGTLRAIKYGCVRAKELDDKAGGKKKAPYLSAMIELADAIYDEVGVKRTKAKKSKVNDEEVKELEAQLEEAKTAVKALEDKLKESEESLEDIDGEVEELELKVKSLEDTNSDLNEANQALVKANEGLIKKEKTAEKKAPAKKAPANKTSTKGGK